ncbi:MAG TPA: sigma-70 family RNA polymerase sigma factor [Candidatus Dormibacteraeota bacterium]|nr:sigma-70 family RNA polymerase sigma factor [Candidatus Dormibacteraeota bacterium]
MAQTAVAAPDFADVYREHLLGVWRYVRSQVPDYHDAQDVTGEVFTRAWRSWPGFDPQRGAVGAWLFRIAQRGVADWHRKRVGERLPTHVALDELEERLSQNDDSPEAVVLQRETLRRLGQALAVLTERERDCLALRFAAGLKIAEVGQVLGVSTGAAKMIISRAISKLADKLAQRTARQTADSPLLLDDLVDEVLERGSVVMSRTELQALVLHLAAIHQPSLPAELPGRVKYCIECAGSVSVARRPRSLLTFAPLSWVTLAPICLACTIPILFAPLAALGVSMGVGVGFHALSLVTAPFVFLLLWRHFRRHRDHLVIWIGGAGALLLMGHLVAHLLGVRVYWIGAVTNQLGVPLLILGSLLDMGAMRRWMAEQRKRMLGLGSPQGATA